MKRALLATLTIGALGASVLVAAPAATAATCYPPAGGAGVRCTDPVGVSASASPAAVTLTSGSRGVALTAVFDDPADIVRGAEFTIKLPNGTTRSAWATGYLSKSGVRETYRASYTAYNFYPPGRYTFSAVAQRDSAKAQSFASVPTVTGSFVVKHRVTTTMGLKSKNYSTRIQPGKKNRLTGKVRGSTNLAGLKVTVQMKAKGKKKKFKKVGKTVKTNKVGEWTSKKYRMPVGTRWRVKVGKKGYVLGSTTKAAKITRRYF